MKAVVALGLIALGSVSGAGQSGSIEARGGSVVIGTMTGGSVVSGAGGSITLNGTTYPAGACNGATAMANEKVYCCKGTDSSSVINGVVKCGNGQPPVAMNGSPASACGSSKTRAHSNGGGIVDERASLPADVFVAAGATVCGKVTAAGGARIEDKAVVTGFIKIGKNVRIAPNATVNGTGEIGDNTTIEPGAQVNRTFRLKNTTIKSGSSFNGSEIALDGVTITGTMNCSGTGTMTCTTGGTAVEPKAAR